MTHSPLTFEAFVEKIVIHNHLVPEDKLAQAKAYIANRPEMSLLHVLVKSRFVTPKHSELISQKYGEYSERHGIKSQSDQPQSEKNDTNVKPKENKEISDVSNFSGEKSPQKTESGPPHTQAAEGVKPSIGVETLSDAIGVVESGMTQTGGSVDVDDAMGKYLETARKMGASDLHISVNSPPLIRKHGRLIALSQETLGADDTEKLLSQVLEEKEKEQLTNDQVLDKCLILNGLRYRSCFIQQQFGWDGSFRLVNDLVPGLKDLGIPEEIKKLTEYREGMVLITGPSGSGKSTTLASLVDHINQKRNEHIITLEHPVEYIFESKKSHVSQREVGLHTSSFSMALRAALREDPDVIVIGELRDKETTSLAVSAAETGHLVFATLHTTSAAQTIYRLLDFFPPDQRNQIRAMISESLRGILCQRLIPKKDGKGMVLALEIMFNVSSIANLIREDRIYQVPNMIQINNMNGMRILNESLQSLVESEIITGEEAYFASDNKERFKRWGPKLKTENLTENSDVKN